MRTLAALILVSLFCSSLFADPITQALQRSKTEAKEDAERIAKKPVKSDQIKIVKLQHLPASEAAETLHQVFQTEGVFFTPHHIGNQIIISRGDAQTVDRAIALLEQLDTPATLYKMECVVLTLTGDAPKDKAESKATIEGMPAGTLLSPAEISAIAEGKLDSVLADLKKAGRLHSLLRPHIVVTENNPGRIQMGGQKASRTGSTVSPRGSRVSSFSFQSVGTLIEITARGEGADTVIAEVNFEDSHLEPAGKGEDAPPPGIGTTTIQSTVRGRHGQFVALAGAIEQNEPRQMLLLIRPTIINP